LNPDSVVSENVGAQPTLGAFPFTAELPSTRLREKNKADLDHHVLFLAWASL
jgi:hypothetical protein